MYILDVVCSGYPPVIKPGLLDNSLCLLDDFLGYKPSVLLGICHPVSFDYWRLTRLTSEIDISIVYLDEDTCVLMCIYISSQYVSQVLSMRLLPWITIDGSNLIHIDQYRLIHL